MSYSKLYDLVNKLSAKTENGELKWEKTEAENAFRASLGSASIRIRSDLSDNFDTVYIISIYKNGTEVERFSDEDLDQNQGTDYYERLKELYSLIRRQALGVEEVIDSVLKDLDALW